MSAEILREAAALMRERAEAANEGPWVSVRNYNGHHDIYSEPGGGSRFELGGDFVPPDAKHIASWHPAVALAVADWLDECARGADEMVDILRSCGERPALNWNSRPLATALAVARAYLGRKS